MDPRSLDHLTIEQRLALDECVDYLRKNFDVTAIFAGGTLVRGTGDPRSDFDIQVVHRDSYRRRIQRYFGGIPFEIFVNPLTRYEQYFTDDAASRRPITAHMIGTSVIVYDTDSVGEALRMRARESLTQLPKPDPDAVHFAKYMAATTFEDVLDLSERDVPAASLLLGTTIWELVRVRILAEDGWLPRPKDTLVRLKEVDPECAELAEGAIADSPFEDRLVAATQLCLRVTNSTGFFEWMSDPEEV